MSDYQTYHIYVNNDPEDKIVITASKIIFDRNIVQFETTHGVVIASFNTDEIVGFVLCD